MSLSFPSYTIKFNSDINSKTIAYILKFALTFSEEKHFYQMDLPMIEKIINMI